MSLGLVKHQAWVRMWVVEVASGPPQAQVTLHWREASQVKSKFRPRTGHEGPEGEYRYSSTLSLTSALDGVGGQRHAPAALPPGKRPRYRLYRRLGGPQGRCGRVRIISPPPGIRSPDRPTRTDYAITAHVGACTPLRFRFLEYDVSVPKHVGIILCDV